MDIDVIFGPMSLGTEADYAGFSAGLGYRLDDSNDAIGCVFSFPKSGTVSDVGFYVTNEVGTSPAYKVGLTNVNISGHPQQTAYGGSSIDNVTFTTSGWVWHTLSTPATVVAGEVGAVHIFPTTPAPDTSNYVEIQDDEFIYYVGPNNATFSTAWILGFGPNSMAIRYDDGDVAGLALIGSNAYDLIAGTSPDEIGNKFTVPTNMTCKGAKIWLYFGGGVINFKSHLYDNNDNELRVISGYTSQYGDDYYMMDVYWNTPVNLVANTPYRVTFEQVSGQDPGFIWWKFESVASRSTLTIPQSDRWHSTERTNGGSWTDSEDKITWMGLVISSIEGTAEDGEGTNRFGFAG